MCICIFCASIAFCCCPKNKEMKNKLVTQKFLGYFHLNNFNTRERNHLFVSQVARYYCTLSSYLHCICIIVGVCTWCCCMQSTIHIITYVLLLFWHFIVFGCCMCAFDIICCHCHQWVSASVLCVCVCMCGRVCVLLLMPKYWIKQNSIFAFDNKHVQRACTHRIG